MKRLLLGLALVLTACGREDSTSTTGETTAGLVFFNPTHLPSGVKIGEVTLQRSEQEQPFWGAKVGRPTGNGKFRDILSIVATKTDTPREVGADEQEASRRVDVNGHEALLSDHSLIGVTVSWFQDGYDVGVIGQPGSGDVALDVARRVRLAANADEARLEGAPAGMELITEWGSSGYPRQHYSMSGSETPTALHINVAVVPVEFPPALLGVGHESDATRQVRGHPAFLMRQVTDIGDRELEQVTLAWAERPDLVVTIAGTISADEAFAIAAGLREESEQAWRSHFNVRDS